MRTHLKTIPFFACSSLTMLAIGVLGIAQPGIARGASIGVLANEVYNTSGNVNDYTDTSSIPVSSTDLIEGLAPTAADLVPIGAGTGAATNYVGTFEALGGTTAPLTDGTTGVGNNAVTSAPNALFDTVGNWYIVYTLPSPATINNIFVTTGAKDSRVDQNFDILVSTDGATYTSLSDGSSKTALNTPGTGFSYAPVVQPGSNGNGVGGAAQSEVVPVIGQSDLGQNVKYIEFVAMNNGGNIYRELDVNGATTAVPLPRASWGGLLLLGGLGARQLHRRRQMN